VSELRVGALPATCDVLVVGGGIVGCATAFEAARAGLSVVVVERRPLLASSTTAASAGGFRAQFDDPDEIALMRESIGVFERFGEHVGVRDHDLRMKQQGYVWLTTSEAGAREHAAVVARQRSWGLDHVELLSGDEARRELPYLSPSVVSARLRRRDGWLDPVRLTLGFARASRATFAFDTEVAGFDVEAGRLARVRTSAGDVTCGACVLAAGPFVRRMAARAGLDLPLVLRTRHRLMLPDVPEVPPTAPMTIDEDTGAHFRPEGGGALAMYPHDAEPDAAPLDHVPADPAFALRLLDPESPASLARVAPFWRDVWSRRGIGSLVASGQYALTPDRKPWIGPTPIGGLFLNAGYGGTGIMASPAGARRLVEAITNPGAPPGPFDPRRDHRARPAARL
jgi:sarcosine oxidase subunit beta